MNNLILFCANILLREKCRSIEMNQLHEKVERFIVVVCLLLEAWTQSKVWRNVNVQNDFLVIFMKSYTTASPVVSP